MDIHLVCNKRERERWGVKKERERERWGVKKERGRERWGVKKEREPPLTVRYERKRRFLSDEKQNAPVIQHPDVSRKKCFSAPPL